MDVTLPKPACGCAPCAMPQGQPSCKRGISPFQPSWALTQLEKHITLHGIEISQVTKDPGSACRYCRPVGVALSPQGSWPLCPTQGTWAGLPSNCRRPFFLQLRRLRCHADFFFPILMRKMVQIDSAMKRSMAGRWPASGDISNGGEGEG